MSVLIADKSNSVALIKRALPKKWQNRVIVAEDGERVAEILATKPPKLAVLNCTLPKVSGIDICKNLQQQPTNFTYVILVAEGGIENLIAGVKSGANDVILHPYDTKELKEALVSGLTTPGASSQANDSPKLSYEPLTNRQLEILKLISTGSSNSEIAKALGVTVGTVKSHINHILGKLYVPSRAKALIKASQIGLI